MNAFREILVATDFSGGSDAGVDFACALAEIYGSRIHIMHVLEESPMNYLGVMPSREIHEDAEQTGQERLENVLSSADRARFRAKFVLQSGYPAEEIIDYAERNHIDMIVLSTHGEKSWAEGLSGNVSDQVVRLASCPVVTVPSLAKSRGSRIESLAEGMVQSSGSRL